MKRSVRDYRPITGGPVWWLLGLAAAATLRVGQIVPHALLPISGGFVIVVVGLSLYAAAVELSDRLDT